MVAIASALVLSVGCESIDMPPMSRDNSSDQPGLGFEPSGNSTIDAYDLIVYDRIERKWREVLDTSASLSNDHSPGRVRVTFRLHRDGRITDLMVVERTAKSSQAAACVEAIKRVSDLPPWPLQVKSLVWSDNRDLTFTFYYATHFTRLVREIGFLAPPFLAYDRVVINAIQQKWYSYLDQTQKPTEKGEVTVEFILHRDGTISDVQVTRSSVTGPYAEICRQAVLDAGQFAAWPEDMRRRIEKDYRKLLFRFYLE
jgi:TonB family protein